MSAWYNEIDPFAAAWLRELIKAGLIADGEVDERDIRDIKPGELSGYTQCHFFAGIGAWSYALRLAGWPDDRPVWTGSAPCQPFSAAGAGKGTSDERHLWPHFFHLISTCKPDTIFGEQVEAAIRHGWLDLVQDDLEGVGYVTGAVGFPAASVGAPHIRQRLYFVAHSNNTGLEGRRGVPECSGQRFVGPGSVAGELAHPNGGHSSAERQQRSGEQRLFTESRNPVGLADAQHTQRRPEHEVHGDTHGRHGLGRSGATGGFWSNADWIWCRDEKFRPVEPGTFPLAHGVPARVGRLRGYGNAIVPQVAATFIEAALDTIGDG